MKIADMAFGCLLILACCGHTLGTIQFYQAFSTLWVWSLAASLAGFVLAALNLLRAARVHDKALAAITLPGTAAFALIALGFGISIHNPADLRVVGHLIIATALIGFSLVTLFRRPGIMQD